MPAAALAGGGLYLSTTLLLLRTAIALACPAWLIEHPGASAGAASVMARSRTIAKALQGEFTSEEPSAFGLGLDNLLGYNLRRAHALQKQRFASVFGPLGIRPVTLSALGTIYDHPNIPQTDLGKRLHINRANMVPLLAELSSRGLVKRRPSKVDRRAQLVSLTPAGKKLTSQLIKMHERLEADSIKTLGVRESEQLLTLLRKFRRLAPNPHVEID
jgi:DNA-binding MarR family transcriptional regulator